ncbi:glucose 1-dehydrogenase [Bacillus sp. HMF5848]|uniref:SDR family NAD(P)-dependent oxidoreductase n=1 Tax=Bacillus sp. HMF5848 TaxID=2495421 RepID=UPI000F789AE7|nr:glucose 1-dehydrogenase [Bacillus sp. HMF5848]RSK27369.1 glucose 1-dehydrogenase [Bacillus sp. HMF5848]
MRFEDKVVLITGAGGGIGRATALQFAIEGAKVIVSDIDEALGSETEALVRESGGEALFIQANVTVEKEVDALVTQGVKAFGGIDVLFNNAGIGHEEKKLADLSFSEWQSVLNVNLDAVFLGMKYAIPELIKRGGGAVVNTSSLLGLKGKKYMAAYNASKGGVILLTQNAALEYGKQGVRINAIAPGVIDTAIVKHWREDERRWPIISRANALGRIGQPDEVAKAVLFLASDDASFITGTTLSIDGGGLPF